MARNERPAFLICIPWFRRKKRPLPSRHRTGFSCLSSSTGSHSHPPNDYHFVLAHSNLNLKKRDFSIYAIKVGLHGRQNKATLFLERGDGTPHN